MSKLRRPKKKETYAEISSVALGGLVMAQIVGSLDLDQDDKDFVNNELKWLFEAIDNFLSADEICKQQLADEKKKLIDKERGGVLSITSITVKKRIKQGLIDVTPSVWAAIVEQSKPIAIAVPDTAEVIATANNKLLPSPTLPKYVNDLYDVLFEASLGDLWSKTIAEQLKYIEDALKRLDTHLGREARLGQAGADNVVIQENIRLEQSRVMQYVNNLADLMGDLYGIQITSPNEVVQFLEE
ncbi:MAG: hypothetical protein AAF485_09755 [Chloroflexota bacterium]